jgi:hypothetical protein
MNRIGKKLAQGALWLQSRRRMLNAWVVRAVSFYFGYKILNHEIYHADHTDALLVFLGLWLCGVAPATFFDSMRKANEVLHGGNDAANAPTDSPINETREHAKAVDRRKD